MRSLSFIKRESLKLFIILIFPSLVFGQSSSSRTDTPFLLPQTIFVGDSGRLVVPLGQAYTAVEPFVLDTPEMLSETPELLIKRIELERRGGSSRLLIDFIPYVPGLVTFPSLDYITFVTRPSGVPLPAITELEVHVASILNPSEMTLSNPATPLAVPGTSFLVYGTLTLVFLFIFLGVGGSLWGRRHFRELWERLRRRHLLRVMTNFLQRLRKESLYKGKESPGYYLSLLSGELREFLSHFTGVNCRSLTAGEFLDLSLGYENAEAPEDERLLNPFFLCSLFRNWDILRFSGRGVDRVELFLALKETGDFIAALDRAEREKPLQQTENPEAAES